MLNIDKSVRVLEFDKILSILSGFAPTEGSRKKALSLTPSSNKNTIIRRQELTENAKALMAVVPHTQRISLGIVYVIPVL